LTYTPIYGLLLTMNNTSTIHISQCLASPNSIRLDDIEIIGELKGDFFRVTEAVTFEWDDDNEDYVDRTITTVAAVNEWVKSIPNTPHTIDNIVSVFNISDNRWYKVVYRNTEDDKFYGVGLAPS
jgi:hypothetical protein